MSTALQQSVAAELEALREAGTYKRFNTLVSPQGPVVEMAGRGEVIVLSSNNYLGLANRPEVVEAGIEGLRAYGAGTASVRFICGTFAPHHELEEALARFSATEAALTYVSCWNANEAVVPSLTDETTVILSDELNHASIVDAVRLSKPARKTRLPPLRPRRAPRGARLLRAGAAEARAHRRRVLDGGRPRAAAGDPRARARARRDRARRRLARRRRDGRDRAAASRSTSACSARST